MANKGIIAALRDAFDGFKGPNSASIHRFVSIDVEATARRLEIAQLGEKNGKANIPSPDSRDLDSAEQAIVDHVSSYIQDYYQDYIKEGQTYIGRTAGGNQAAVPEQMLTEAKNAIVEFEVTAKQIVADLHTARGRAVENEAEVTRFRTEHRLQRPAIRTDANWIFAAGFIGIILLAEMILNGYFLSKGSQLGLLGGVLEALIIALINVTIAGMVGRLAMPNMHHRNWLRKLSGTIIFLAYLGAIFGFNLAVGHYRDAVATNPFEGAILAGRSLRAHPLGIEDLSSWALVLMGCLFSVMALLKLYWMDDPYPGYGERHRAWIDAAEDYNDAHADGIDQLRELMENTRMKLADMVNQVSAEQNERIQAIAAATGARAGMRKFIEDCQRAGNLLLKTYRDANVMARTQPPPPRFNDGSTWKPHGFDLDVYEFGAVNADVVEARIAEANKTNREWIDRLMEAYAAAQKSIDAIGVILIPGEARNRPTRTT
jgi:hypothetical protein